MLITVDAKRFVYREGLKGVRANIATMKDVARMANVSIATVSLVINDGPVRDTTRARVQDAIRKLRYIPQNHGRGLRSGRSHAIGLYVMNAPDVDDLSTEAADFWFQLIRGVQAICQENEYYFSFESLTWREPERLLRRALSRLNDGAIIIPQYHRHYSFLSELQAFKYPYVMYNPCVPVGAAHSVFAMDRQAQREMTAYRRKRALVDRVRRGAAGTRRRAKSLQRIPRGDSGVERLPVTGAGALVRLHDARWLRSGAHDPRPRYPRSRRDRMRQRLSGGWGRSRTPRPRGACARRRCRYRLRRPRRRTQRHPSTDDGRAPDAGDRRGARLQALRADSRGIAP